MILTQEIPSRWSEFEWPDWVPREVREQVESFWSEKFFRSPAAWYKNVTSEYNNHPELGTRVRCRRQNENEVTGRWVPAWNNIGRIVLDDGKYKVESLVYLERV